MSGVGAGGRPTSLSTFQAAGSIPIYPVGLLMFVNQTMINMPLISLVQWRHLTLTETYTPHSLKTEREKLTSYFGADWKQTTLPTLLIVTDSGNIPLLVKVSRHRVSSEPPFSMDLCDFPSGAQTCVAVDSKSEVWGVGAEGVDKKILITKCRSRTRHSVSDLNIEQFKLHIVMGADVQFLHTFIAIQM
jgi:hypothetical protein